MYRRPDNDDLADSMPDHYTTLPPAAALALERSRRFNEYRKTCPTAQLRRMAYTGKRGDSILFPQYQRSGQLGAIIANVGDITGARFACSRELSLVDGSPAGVRVTLVREAD